MPHPLSPPNVRPCLSPPAAIDVAQCDAELACAPCGAAAGRRRRVVRRLVERDGWVMAEQRVAVTEQREVRVVEQRTLHKPWRAQATEWQQRQRAVLGPAKREGETVAQGQSSRTPEPQPQPEEEEKEELTMAAPHRQRPDERAAAVSDEEELVEQLGVRLRAARELQGAVAALTVLAVARGSAAERAGLVIGDSVLRVNGAEVRGGVEQLRRRIAAACSQQPPPPLVLRLLRDRRRHLTLTLLLS